MSCPARPGRVFAREELLQFVGDDTRDSFDRTLDVGSVPAFYQRGRGYDIDNRFRPECPLDNPNNPSITTAAGVAGATLWDIRGGSQRFED